MWAVAINPDSGKVEIHRDMQNAYFDALHNLAGASKLDRPKDTPSLKHQYVWAWYVQEVLSTTTAVYLLVYVGAKTRILC
jgi:hypothetical protein